MKFFRRLLIPFLVVFVVNTVLAGGYWLLYLGRNHTGGGPITYLDCLYMTVITTFTVGYGEFVPIQTSMDRIYTMLVILSGAGVIGYGVSQLTAFIVEGELRNLLGRRRMEKQLAALSEHYIVCGAGDVGHYVVVELQATKRPFVVVDLDEPRLRRMSETQPFPYLAEDATDEAVLTRAGIQRAAGIMCALPGDRDNLFLAMTARQLNPKLRIVSQAHDIKLAGRLKNAGADSVVSPQYIGGLRIVSEMVRPSVVSFLDTMLRDKTNAPRVEEVRVETGSPVAGKRLNELDLSKRKLLVMAVRPPASDKVEYVPPADTAIAAGTTLILLGDIDRVNRFREEAKGKSS